MRNQVPSIFHWYYSLFFLKKVISVPFSSLIILRITAWKRTYNHLLILSHYTDRGVWSTVVEWPAQFDSGMSLEEWHRTWALPAFFSSAALFTTLVAPLSRCPKFPLWNPGPATFRHYQGSFLAPHVFLKSWMPVCKVGYCDTKCFKVLREMKFSLINIKYILYIKYK